MMAGGPAAAQICRLCDETPTVAAPAPAPRPLRVEVEGGLQFGRLALSGAQPGEAVLDARAPDRLGERALIDLGGARYAATVRVTGEPGFRVRVSWPDMVALRPSGGGATVRLEAIRADRGPVLVLGPSGRAELRLGARLVVPAGASGDYRGQVPIDADYE